MPLQLNKITNDSVEIFLADTLNQLEETERRLSFISPEQYDEWNLFLLGSLNLKAGFMFYQQQHLLGDAMNHLRRASIFFHRLFSYSSPPSESEVRDARTFETSLSLDVCFGKEHWRRQLASVPRSVWEPAPTASAAAFIEYVLLLQAHLSGARMLTDEERASLEEKCESETASREDQKVTRFKVRGLGAIVDEDEEEWNDAIFYVVSEFEDEAILGDLQYLVTGFACLPALMLTKLGLEKEMTCSVESPYLPLSLLGVS